jgi:ribosomal protein L2
VIATNGLGAGDVLRSSADAPVLPGVTKALREMPTGTVIHSIELRAGRGAKMCRSAGTSATLLKNTDEKGRSLILLPSGVLQKLLRYRSAVNYQTPLQSFCGEQTLSKCSRTPKNPVKRVNIYRC